MWCRRVSKRQTDFNSRKSSRKSYNILIERGFNKSEWWLNLEYEIFTYTYIDCVHSVFNTSCKTSKEAK